MTGRHSPRIVGLGGGIGAARFWSALLTVVDPRSVTLVVNVADDLWIHGLKVCPDIDTTMYALAGRRDAERGWGLRDETWHCMDTMRSLGEPVWFNLGDRDLATHLLRTGELLHGRTLTEVTAHLARQMGVEVTVLPATDDEVATEVTTTDGERLTYEEFLVRRDAQPRLARVDHVGLDTATATPAVRAAIAQADLIVLAPSHPIASIGPILGLDGLATAVARGPAPVVAITPVVTGVSIGDPGEQRRARSRRRCLDTVDVPATATGVASLYRGLIDRFVIDAADADQAQAIADMGMEVATVQTLVHLGADPGPLLDAVLSPATASTTATMAVDARR